MFPYFKHEFYDDHMSEIELEKLSYEDLMKQLLRKSDDLEHALETGELCPKCHTRFKRDPKRSRGFVYMNCPNPNCLHQERRDIENEPTVSR